MWDAKSRNSGNAQGENRQLQRYDEKTKKSKIYKVFGKIIIEMLWENQYTGYCEMGEIPTQNLNFMEE